MATPTRTEAAHALLYHAHRRAPQRLPKPPGYTYNAAGKVTRRIPPDDPLRPLRIAPNKKPAELACRRCEAVKPWTAEFFTRRTITTSGLSRQCKACDAKRVRDARIGRLRLKVEPVHNDDDPLLAALPALPPSISPSITHKEPNL